MPGSIEIHYKVLVFTEITLSPGFLFQLKQHMLSLNPSYNP